MDCQQIAKTVGWFGETWGFWVQTGALFLSAVAGVLVIYYNGRQARTKALIDLIIYQKTNKDLVEATKLVYRLGVENKHFSSYAPEDQAGPSRDAILLVLNNQEFIAVGIRKRVFDEGIYKQMQCSNLLKVWRLSNGFVAELRKIKGQDTIFQDVERLADKWKRNPIKSIKR
ncbi:MAG: DUF4760 domain-containing protein [Janthinobacterium lividum]